MKTKLLFWALVAIALGACTNENENFPSDSNEDVVVLKILLSFCFRDNTLL